MAETKPTLNFLNKDGEIVETRIGKDKLVSDIWSWSNEDGKDYWGVFDPIVMAGTTPEEGGSGGGGGSIDWNDETQVENFVTRVCNKLITNGYKTLLAAAVTSDLKSDSDFPSSVAEEEALQTAVSSSLTGSSTFQTSVGNAIKSDVSTAVENSLKTDSDFIGDVAEEVAANDNVISNVTSALADNDDFISDVASVAAPASDIINSIDVNITE